VPYAEDTKVAPDRSRAEIESTLARYGATAFSYGTDEEAGAALVMFRAHGRIVRFELSLPREADFARTPTGIHRSAGAARAAYEKEVRRLWRALALAVKAKLEVVESGIATFEEEFLAHVVLPDNTRVGAWLEPQLAEVYATGGMPELLPGAVTSK
jgi:hypothetical protein